MVNLRGQGWSLRRIAAKLGVSDFTVRKDIEDSGAIKHAPATVTSSMASNTRQLGQVSQRRLYGWYSARPRQG